MARPDETQRLFEMTSYERPLWEAGLLPGGMDEAGRGPLAGPVVAAFAALPGDELISFVNDSKKLSEKRREELYPKILEKAVACGVGWAEHDEIDELNILNATRLAFKRAYDDADFKCPVVLVDAVKSLDIAAEQKAIIHGDALSYLIAAASIVAKVRRDTFMREMHEKYPVYGFDKNKGYGTKAHIAALREYGPCPIHRRSFIGKFC